MGGWGSTGINVDPEGRCCPAMRRETIPGLVFETVRRPAAGGDLGGRRRRSRRSAARTGCRSPAGAASGADVDFGGCRCQAMALAGDPAATDPVCVKSPHHAALLAAAEADAGAEPGAFTYRRMPAPALTP